MPGKQLVPYLAFDPDNPHRDYEAGRTRWDRFQDRIELWFTGGVRSPAVHWLVGIVVAFLISHLLVVVVLAINDLSDGTIIRLSTRPNGSGLDLYAFLAGKLPGQWWQHFDWFWLPFVVLAYLATQRTITQGVPQFYRDRKSDREAGYRQRQERADAIKAAEAAAIEAAKERRQAEVQARQDHLQQRQEVRREIEDSLQKDIARAKHHLLFAGDLRPDGDVEMVREQIRSTIRATGPTPPIWGLLRESTNNNIRRLMADSADWLPPPVPYPPGCGPQNPDLTDELRKLDARGL